MNESKLVLNIWFGKTGRHLYVDSSFFYQKEYSKIKDGDFVQIESSSIDKPILTRIKKHPDPDRLNWPKHAYCHCCLEWVKNNNLEKIMIPDGTVDNARGIKITIKPLGILKQIWYQIKYKNI